MQAEQVAAFVVIAATAGSGSRDVFGAGDGFGLAVQCNDSGFLFVKVG